jgi:C4-dicarboxylate-specific signal transduction histidine kinase
MEMDLAANLPMVKGDEVQLQQVLLNLVANGCDAMVGIGPSDRKLTLRTELAAEKGVTISVADRGAGVPPEQMENIFLPFVTTKKNGMGLGLAVCRSIVSAHGGKLWATNEAQKGARFNILLPAAE